MREVLETCGTCSLCQATAKKWVVCDIFEMLPGAQTLSMKYTVSSFPPCDHATYNLRVTIKMPFSVLELSRGWTDHCRSKLPLGMSRQMYGAGVRKERRASKQEMLGRRREENRAGQASGDSGKGEAGLPHILSRKNKNA